MKVKSVSAAFHRYNANSKDQNVGDCVKRALSFAYGMDYNAVGRELNRIKNAIGSYAYNVPRTYKQFLRDRKAVLLDKSHIGMTEEEFCESHPTGTYILLTGPQDKDYSTHMVCIYNGDIIDSWNSSEYKVYEAFEVKNAPTTYETVTWDDLESELTSFIDQYIEKLNKKYSDWFQVSRADGTQYNDSTYGMRFYLVTSPNLPSESSYYPNRKYMKRIIVKINPRMDLQGNLDSLKPKLKQSVYEWTYPYAKDKRDLEEVKTFENPKYDGRLWEKKQLLKLPAWVRPLVQYFWYDDREGYHYYNKYELRFKALPEDPYIEDRGDDVRIETETYKELKDALEMYRTKFWRVGYDY